MHITRTLQGGILQRLSPEAQELVEKFSAWFVQFPKLTYIRVQGCYFPPLMLPRYPTDKLILLELVRQLTTYNKVQKNKLKTKTSFPVSLGKSLKVCPSLQSTEKIDEEFMSFSLQPYIPRDNFDPHDNIQKTSGKKHRHPLQ